MFLLCLIYKRSYVLRPVSFQLDVSEMFRSGISSIYNGIMHDLNCFLSFSITKLTLPSFTIKIDVFSLFISLYSHSGLFP